MKAKIQFYLMLGMIIFVVSAFVTGLQLHFVAHHAHAHPSSLLTNLHLVTAIGFAISATTHAYARKAWYKRSLQPIRFKKLLTLLFTLVFSILSITGIMVWIGSTRTGVHVGIFHYQLGLALAAFVVLHVAQRFRFLRNHLKYKA